MAPKISSVRSEEALNVSQGAESSPLDTQRPPAADERVEIVEDSYPKATEALQGGAVQPPQRLHEQDGEDDELYAVSPYATKRLTKEKATVARDSQNLQAPQEEQSRPKSLNEDGAQQIAQGAIDELILRGATVQKETGDSTQQRKARSSAYNIPGASQRSQKQTALTSKTPHEAKPTQQSDTRPVAQKPSGLPTPSITGTKATPAPVMAGRPSAVDALRARQGLSSATPSTATSVKPAATALSTQPKKATASVNHVGSQPSAPKAKSPEATLKPAATKKVPLQGKGRAAHNAPSSSNASAAVSKRKRAALTSSPSGSNVDAGNSGLKKPSVQSKALANSKTTGRVQPKRGAKEDAVYDLSESSYEDSPPPAKKSRPSKGKGAAQPQKKAAPGGSRAAQAQVHNVRSGAKMTSTKQPPSKATAAASASTRNTVRNRMRRASEEPPPAATKVPGSKQKVKLLADEDEDKENESVVVAERDETLEDFEAQVLHYYDEDTLALDQRKANGPLISDKAANKRQRPGANSAKGAAMREQSSNAESRSTTKQLPRSVPGASQDDAIVIPDQLSSERSSISPPALRRAQQHATGNAEMQIRPSAETRAVMRSSPPLRAEQTPAPHSAGFVNPDTTRKAVIIGFNKDGPMNQGRSSAKESPPGSAWTDRSSDPPREAPAKGKARPTGGPSSTAASGRPAKMEKPAPMKNVTTDVQDALAGFMKKDYMPVVQPTVAKPPSVRLTDRSANQTALPPLADEEDDGFTSIEAFEDTTHVIDEQEAAELAKTTEPTASQQAMPPPKLKPRSPRASNVTKAQLAKPAMEQPPIRSTKLGVPSTTATAGSATEMRGKRKLEPSLFDEPPSKRVQRTTRFAATEDDEKRRTTGSVAAPLLRHESGTLSPDTAITTKAANHPSRKPSWHASQGSQKVDIFGSPIPDGMVVDGKATVLEVFSQQANVSSDAGYVDTVIARKPDATTRPTRIREAEMLAPPSAQQQPISSNIKPRPAPPEEHSRAITSHGTTLKGKLLVEDQAERLQTDPFTNLSDSQQPRLQFGSSSNFIEQLRRSADELAHTRNSKQAEVDDPDKTLVEPEHVPRGAKRTVSLSTAPSSEASSQDSQAASALSDLGLWRNALLPHQMNLFDELVNVAHRVVRHLVDQETAVTDIVEDYQRRGVQLVEQMERSHVAQHEKFVASLQERKKRLRKELAACGGKLGDGFESVKKAKGQRGRDHGAGKSGLRKGLQSVLEQYC
ncbi:uncharacterized protein LTR77_010200 [Saxophila tyrrhenica]|uniref:Uncharacterized protein n=1 Tax=Saxophila tyrrhenica TaxID=1690608 RepID=A0AAV9NW47_9PEZI|nr:hypothetical protein LTR77_010200 [Saxophila tyrrhenica]